MHLISRLIPFLRHLVVVPCADPDERRRVRLSNILALGLIAITSTGILFITALTAFQLPLDASFSTILRASVAFVSGLVVVVWLNHHRRGQAGSMLFLALLIACIIGANVEFFEHGDDLFYFTIPVFIASFILRPANSFVTAGVISGLTLLSAFINRPSPMVFFSVALLFSVALVAWLAARSLQNSLNELRVMNEELDLRVSRRTQELARLNQRLEEQARALEQANLHLEEQAVALSAANERLRGLDALKSKFMADVTHELRTPVNNLKIYLEMLRTGRAEKVPNFLEVLQEETDQLAHLVEDILNLSRNELKPPAVDLTWVDLNAIAAQVVMASQLRAEECGLSLRLRADPAFPLVRTDPSLIGQVISNLVANSVNYTEHGSIEVRLCHDESQRQIRIQVADTGIGIPPEDMAHIFERFYRGSHASQSNVRGTGLGLPIVKEILDRIGGKIEVQSQVGAGTVISILLPVEG